MEAFMKKKLLILSALLGSFAYAQSIDYRLPIVYDPSYNISVLFGVERLLHPFDTQKYGKIYDSLCKGFALNKNNFYSPQPITDKELTEIHTQAYLDSLKNSEVVARGAEVALLSYMPNWFLQWRILKPMKLAVGGTLLAVQLAEQYGWAINLSGGYHHAKANQAGGFCFFNDISLAAKRFLDKNPESKVMIVDLDAHQGNGHESLSINEPRISIFDIYNGSIYPWDYAVRTRINYDFPQGTTLTDQTYIQVLQEELSKALDAVKPGLIIYNAGTDIYVNDPLGRMKITKSGIIARDETVFDLAISKGIPIVMLLSGGYTNESAEIVADSIKNLATNNPLVKKAFEQVRMNAQQKSTGKFLKK